MSITGPAPAEILHSPSSRVPDTNNFLATNYFKLNLRRAPILTYFCQSVNLPSLTINFADVPVAGVGVPFKNPVGRYSYEQLTVSFIVDEGMRNWREIHDWMRTLSTAEAMGNEEGAEVIPHEERFDTGTLLIMNSSYNPIVRVTLRELFPVGISGIQFSSVSVDNEPVVATATFAYTSYKVENIVNEFN